MVSTSDISIMSYTYLWYVHMIYKLQQASCPVSAAGE